MSTQSTRRSRWLAAGAVLGTTGLVVSGTTVAEAAAVPAGLSFVAATTEVTAYRYQAGGPDGEGSGKFRLDIDFGTHVVAGKEPLEIRVTRPRYDRPPVAQQVVTVGGRKVTKPMPPGTVPSMSGGLKDFTKVTITDLAGKVVLTYDQNFCPNGDYGVTRARPDAPDNNPYPVTCRGSWQENPFLLGAVWGLQAGWSAPAAADSKWDESAPRDLPPGKYKATVVVNPVYRTHFGIDAGKAKADFALTVQDSKPSQPMGALAQKRAEQVTAEKDGVHAHEGDPSQQVAEFSPDLRPAPKRPTAIAPNATSAAVPVGPRPDLRSLPAWDIQLGPGRDDQGEPIAGTQFLSFNATVWNGGTSPLLVDGFRRTGTELMDAYQYFYDATGKQVGSAPAGTMEWDKREGHKHWHFTDFAQYRLLGADKKLVVNSSKEAFCLANTDAVDYTLPNAKWRPTNTDLSTSCGQNTSVAVRQVLDVGGGDTYVQTLPGQSFDVKALKNGTYYIEVAANPAGKLAELSTTNNSSLRKVVLSGSGNDRKVTVPPHEGITG
jgi:hypothetical protein